MGWTLAALFLFLASAAQAQEWNTMCWNQTGGSGLRTCQIEAKFRVQRVIGALVFIHDSDAYDVVIRTGTPLVGASVSVDGSTPYTCDDYFDCRLSRDEADALLAHIERGQSLTLEIRTKAITSRFTWTIAELKRHLLWIAEHSAWERPIATPPK